MTLRKSPKPKGPKRLKAAVKRVVRRVLKKR